MTENATRAVSRDRDYLGARAIGNCLCIALLLTGVWGIGFLAPRAAADPTTRPAAPQKPADLFQETKVWNVHLTFTPEQWEAMEPKGGPGAPGGGPGGPGGP